MIASLLFAALAGWLVPRAEPVLDAVLERLSGGDARLDAVELRALTVFVMLGLAAVAVQAVGADSSLYLGTLGAALGYFGPRLLAFARDPDGAMGERHDDWDGSATGPRRRVGGAGPEPEAGDDDEAGDVDAETLRTLAERLRQEEANRR